MAEQVSRETSSRCERGRDHAWRITNTALKPPALGYCQVVARDANGKPLLGSGQRQLYREIIDPATAPYVKLAFMLRAQQHKSRMEIARIFNSMNVGGRNCWDDGGIRLLLQRQDYVGVEICNRVKNVWQPKTGLYKAVPQPENLWKKRPMPHKRIITDELFNAVQAVEKRIADSG
jgi:site-specific DNA recombinase